jgi:hypothetical protein
VVGDRHSIQIHRHTRVTKQETIEDCLTTSSQQGCGSSPLSKRPDHGPHRQTRRNQSTLFSMSTEGPDKATGGGGEWEPIKILYENLAYVPNLTQRASLLPRSRSHSYRQSIGPWNRVRELELQRKAQIGVSKATSEPTATNTVQQPFSLSHAHSIKHFMCVTNKTP